MSSRIRVLFIRLWKSVPTLNQSDLEGLFGNRINLEKVVTAVQNTLHFLEDATIVVNAERYIVQNVVIISSQCRI